MTSTSLWTTEPSLRKGLFPGTDSGGAVDGGSRMSWLLSSLTIGLTLEVSKRVNGFRIDLGVRGMWKSHGEKVWGKWDAPGL